MSVRSVREDLAALTAQNPEAGAIALVFGLTLQDSTRSAKMMSDLYEGAQEEIRQLEQQLAYWRRLGERYLEIRLLLAAPTREGE